MLFYIIHNAWLHLSVYTKLVIKHIPSTNVHSEQDDDLKYVMVQGWKV